MQSVLKVSWKGTVLCMYALCFHLFQACQYLNFQTVFVMICRNRGLPASLSFLLSKKSSCDNQVWRLFPYGSHNPPLPTGRMVSSWLQGLTGRQAPPRHLAEPRDISFEHGMLDAMKCLSLIQKWESWQEHCYTCQTFVGFSRQQEAKMQCTRESFLENWQSLSLYHKQHKNTLRPQSQVSWSMTI